MFRTSQFIICLSSPSYQRILWKSFIGSMSSRLVAVCQMTAGSDKEKNFEVVRDLVIEAKRRNAAIAFLPEACDYLAENKKDIVAFAGDLDGNLVKQYKELAAQQKIWLSLGGIHEAVPENREKVFNSHLIVNDKGEIVSVYRKIHLFDMDNKATGVRLMESDYAMKGTKIEYPVSTPVGEIGLSIGVAFYIRVNFTKAINMTLENKERAQKSQQLMYTIVGISVQCYDMRFPELALCLRNMGAKILTYPSAFTYQTGAAHWDIILRARAIESQCYVIAAAQTGTHNKKRVSWGHAMIVDPWGSVIAQCSEGTGIAIASIDLESLDRTRQNMPVENHRRTDIYPEIKPLNNL